MQKPVYYDGTKLLSMMDINGDRPEIYLCTSNRTAGKTTYFGRLCVKRFVENKEKFMLLYRFNYELDDCAEKFFKDIGGLFFPGMEMISERKANGTFHELFLGDQSCGYAVSINSADAIKKYSHLFSDVDRMLFDEFQSESEHYCPREVQKFLSVHTSVARGQGKQVRYVPVYMLGNRASLLNPYYVEMGISARLNKETKFLRGNGFVLENGYVDSAARAQELSGVNKAFNGSTYLAAMHSREDVYLNDNTAFIEKLEGKNEYVCTFRYEGCDYAIRRYGELGFMYCDNHADYNFRVKITVTLEDHRVNYVMLKQNDMLLQILRDLFKKGSFRFKNLQCKEACIRLLSL